jgi:hypothetical protein
MHPIAIHTITKRRPLAAGLDARPLLDQIDLPSAYFVYAIGSRLRRQVQRSPGMSTLSSAIQSARFLLDLAEIYGSYRLSMTMTDGQAIAALFG